MGITLLMSAHQPARFILTRSYTADSLPFDHVSSPAAPDAPQAVFYFSPSPTAAPILDYLDRHATLYPSFSFAVRYRPPIDMYTDQGARKRGDRGERRTTLSGYGVELALKKTDYLVVDDRATGGPGSSSSTGANNSRQTHSGPFSHVLGEDPWSELSTPLTKMEVRGEPRIWLQLTARAWHQDVSANHVGYGPPYCPARCIARLPEILCCDCAKCRDAPGDKIQGDGSGSQRSRSSRYLHQRQGL